MKIEMNVKDAALFHFNSLLHIGSIKSQREERNLKYDDGF